MEYIKKEELIKGEIYTHENGCVVQHQYLDRLSRVCGKFINQDNNYFPPTLEEHAGRFTTEKLKLATPEKKHWLNECIKLDKFISCEEAMKTFIPEYVEAVSNKHSSSEIIGTIYKTSELPKWVQGHKLEEYWKAYMFHYKPSTKEAYDAQFKNKEVVKVKPFEILETCRKNSNIIKQVINEEGNIFMIDDIITPTIVDSINRGKGFKITGFRLNVDKSMICAITDTHAPHGIGIDKIEHFIEKDEFVLPEKWYVLITEENQEILSKWRSPTGNKLSIGYITGMCQWSNQFNNRLSKEHNPKDCIKNESFDFGNEITFKQFKKYVLKEEYKLKVGDKFQINGELNNYFYIITKIIDCENSYCEFKNEYGYRCGIVLLKNIKIIK